MAMGQVGQSPCWVEAVVSFHSSHSGKQAKRGPLETAWTEERQAQGGDVRRHTEGQVQSPTQNQAADSLPVTRITSSWDVPLGIRVWWPAAAPRVSGAFPARRSRSSVHCPPLLSSKAFPGLSELPPSSPPPGPPCQHLVQGAKSESREVREGSGSGDRMEGILHTDVGAGDRDGGAEETQTERLRQS